MFLYQTKEGNLCALINMAITCRHDYIEIIVLAYVYPQWSIFVSNWCVGLLAQRWNSVKIYHLNPIPFPLFSITV